MVYYQSVNGLKPGVAWEGDSIHDLKVVAIDNFNDIWQGVSFQLVNAIVNFTFSEP
jgi:hypothetical protein